MATYEEALKSVSGTGNNVIAIDHKHGNILTQSLIGFKISSSEAACYEWTIYDKRRKYTVEGVTAPGVCFDPREAKEIINQLGDKITPSKISPTALVLPVKDNTFHVNYDAVFFNAAIIDKFEKEVKSQEIVTDSGHQWISVMLPPGAKPGKWKVTCERIGDGY